MKSIWNKIGCILSLGVILVACQTTGQEEVDPQEYSWVVSDISPQNGLVLSFLKKGQDGQLYAFGFVGDVRVFAILENRNWEILAEVNDINFGDFTAFRDTIYYSSENGIKKARGTFVRSVLDTFYCGLEAFNDQIIIAGSPISYDGQDYTIMSFDGDKTFDPMDQSIQSGRMRIVGDKLFIEGMPMKIYDGHQLVDTEFYGGCLNIDSDGSIYSWLSPSDSLRIVNRMVDGQLEAVGNTIRGGVNFSGVEFNSKTTVLYGFDPKSNKWKSYYLDSNNKWYRISTSFTFLSMINYQDTILAVADNGQIMELVRTNHP